MVIHRSSHYEQSHVMVIGISGVGSWAVEALARTGIGEITLVDMDVVAASQKCKPSATCNDLNSWAVKS